MLAREPECHDSNDDDKNWYGWRSKGHGGMEPYRKLRIQAGEHGAEEGVRE